MAQVLECRDGWADEPSADVEIWFRGVKRNSYRLIPGAYWRTNCDENSLFLSFQAMVPSYVQQRPADEWEWYYRLATSFLGRDDNEPRGRQSFSNGRHPLWRRRG